MNPLKRFWSSREAWAAATIATILMPVGLRIYCLRMPTIYSVGYLEHMNGVDDVEDIKKELIICLGQSVREHPGTDRFAVDMHSEDDYSVVYYRTTGVLIYTVKHDFSLTGYRIYRATSNQVDTKIL